ncbi:MAG: S-layer homology domain-containing protein [Oscillospiraceae bacterium]|nr:S-layer homology domain-containing protein [Oscillospiraceae bacterium]MBP3313282.1 S-layer homology domain-containing protein [Oscillospiraceae bacterium]
MKKWITLFLVCALTLSLGAGALAVESPFIDVHESHWFYESVAYVQENGLMEGTDNGFDPHGVTTRAQMVTILWRLAGEPVVNYAMDYTDIPAHGWYVEAVRWASAQNIALGYGNGKFGPQDIITREQMVTMFHRYSAMEGKSMLAEGTLLSAYSDTADISDFAKNAVAWAVGEGLLKGIDGKLSPKSTATRAQTATVLQRLQEQVLLAEDNLLFPSTPGAVYSAEELLSAVKEGGNIILANDIALTEKTTPSAICLVVDQTVTIDLNGYDIASPDTVFYVIDGGKLTIVGDGNVICGRGGEGPAVAVYADGGEALLQGGSYQNEKTYADAVDGHAADLIYAVGGGKITITDGYFAHTENVWTLNSAEDGSSSIAVKGGKFEGFDPASTSFLVKGYETTEENGVFAVSPKRAEASSLTDVKDAINSGALIVDAQGATLGDFYYTVKFTDNVTVQNAKFTYFYGGNVQGTVTFENCEFVSAHSYSANFDSGNGNIIFNNCTFDGWSSFGTAIKHVEMNNCTFLKTYNYGVLRFYQDAVLNNCTFADNFQRIDSNLTGTEIHFNKCTGIDGKVFNNGSTIGKWFVDGKDVSSTIE